MKGKELYPEGAFLDAAGQKYRPSNGTDGEMFQAMWCDKCRLEPDQDQREWKRYSEK